MKNLYTKKLILQAANPDRTRTADATVWISSDLYSKISILAVRTGKSMRELVAILLRYAIENTVLEAQDQLEE